jgi:hypothetical protein
MPIHRGIKQCTYVRHDGRRCGSPAAGSRGAADNDRCYHHDRERYPDPIEITPHLRELADIFADPLFHEHLQLLSARLNEGSATMQELEDTISTLIGSDLREMSKSSATQRLRGEESGQERMHRGRSALI